MTALLEQLSGIKVMSMDTDRMLLQLTLQNGQQLEISLMLDPLTTNIVDVQVKSDCSFSN